MQSCLYEGRVRHRRFRPLKHEFAYRLYLLYLDLDELSETFRGRWLWSMDRPAPARFCRSDYLGDPRVPLGTAVRELVTARTGRVVSGPVRLLTQARHFGYSLNPISLYFCFDAAGEAVETVVAEVTNTPWRERHCYVLQPEQGHGHRHWDCRFGKQMHVSPFLDMDVAYRLRIAGPAARLVVQLDALQDSSPTLDATLTLTRREITTARLNMVLLRYPLASVRSLAGIYAQALWLWWKQCPAYDHPLTTAPSAKTLKGA